jgi:hypothetical protein
MITAAAKPPRGDHPANMQDIIKDLEENYQYR